MDKLGQLEVTTGLEIHGLLVGNTESAPLAKLCTDWDGQNRLHSFLVKYEADIQEQRSKKGYEYGRSGTHRRGASQLFSSLLCSTTSFRRARGRYSLRLSAYVQRPLDVGVPRLRSFEERNLGTDQIVYEIDLDGEMRKLLRVQVPGDDEFVGVFLGRDALNQYQKLMIRVVKVRGRWMTFKSDQSQIMNQSQALYHAAEAEARAMTDRIAIGRNASRHKQQLDEKDDVSGVIRQAITVLQTGLVEREVEVKLLLLTVLCREHILLLGPPGTGKSELGRRLASIRSTATLINHIDSQTARHTELIAPLLPPRALPSHSGGKGVFFERLLTKYTLPEELFGPLSLAALENDEYIRNTDGYLPTATVAFLDEIFKSNSAILNSLLTILNERKFDNSNQRINVPLLAVVAASNELPDNEELDALYDRFLFRRFVGPVSDNAFDNLLSLPMPLPPNNKINCTALLSEELLTHILHQAAMVTLSKETKLLLRDVRAHLRNLETGPVYISDRRFVKAANMIRVAAASENRVQVTTLDCLLLQHVLWHSVEDQQMLQEYLWTKSVPDSMLPGLEFVIEKLFFRVVQVLKVEEMVAVALSQKPSNGTEAVKPRVSWKNVNPLEDVNEEFDMYINILSSHAVEFRELASETMMGNVWLSTAEVVRVKQELFQRAMNQSAVMQRLLSAVVAMQAVVEHEVLDYASKVEVLDHLWRLYNKRPGNTDTTPHDRLKTITQVLQEINESIRAAKEQTEREKTKELELREWEQKNRTLKYEPGKG